MFIKLFFFLFKKLKDFGYLLFSWLLKIVRLNSSYQSVFTSDFSVYNSKFNLKNKLLNYFFRFELSDHFMFLCCAMAIYRIFDKSNLNILTKLSKFSVNRANVLNLKKSLDLNSNFFKNGNEFPVVNDQLKNFGEYFYKNYENRSVFSSTTPVFNHIKSKKIHIDPTLLNNKFSAASYVTDDAKLNLNFQALEDFKSYLLLADFSFLEDRKVNKITINKFNKDSLKYKNALNDLKKNRKVSKIKNSNNLSSSTISKEVLLRTKGLVDQINFILSKKHSIIDGSLNIRNLNLDKEIKDVLLGYNFNAGPYGSDTTLYSSDVSAVNRLTVVRRVSLFSEKNNLDNINSFKNKVGFFNFSAFEHEENELSVDMPVGGFFSGKFFSINFLLVIFLVIYSIFEFCLIFYFMSKIFGGPYQTINFFFKYPLVYYYENLVGFPSANYFFFSLAFWLIVFVMFSNFLLELIDEERFNPPRLSWLFSFVKEFFYDFVFFACIIFCVAEILMFLDLLFTRFFYVGTPGYPQVFTSLFLMVYEIFIILGTTNYFSLYFDSFIYFDIKFPVFYFSDFVPFLQRYPLVQPQYLANSHFSNPNFFLWLLDNFVSNFFFEKKKTFFFSENTRLIFQRELIQDLRKYNYLRKYILDLRLVGQLFSRGLNGFNYRLDLKYINTPIIAEEQIVRFDWRFKNSHFDGFNTRLFRPDLFGSSQKLSFSATKKIKFFKHKYETYSPRYGYFEYLNSPSSSNFWVDSGTELKEREQYYNFLNSKSKLLSKIPNTEREYFRFHFSHPAKSKFEENPKNSLFLFSPSNFKFLKMKRLHLLIPTKTQRNFSNSRLLLNPWSFVSGNTKPRLPFKYKSFIPLTSFSKISFENYLSARSLLNETYFRPKFFGLKSFNNHLPFNKKGFRELFLKDPQRLFGNRFLDSRYFFITDYFKKMKFSSGAASNKSISQSTFLKVPNFVSTGLINKQRSKEDGVLKQLISKKRRTMSGNAKELVVLQDLPNYPYNLRSRKYHSIFWFFLNTKPYYFLKPTSVFTTFSSLNSSFTSNLVNYSFFDYNFTLTASSGLLYPLNVFFSGFSKLNNYNLKLLSFDYYYAQNHNFFHSFMDLFFKLDQFITIPNNKGRFNDIFNGGLNHSLDFMYPMISELRFKEKIIPLNFSYIAPKNYFWNIINFDPYINIRNAKLSKGSCYFLDSRIQNWFFYQNVIWNDYYHFFFNRSYKTEGNGSKFCLASFNPINGPQSYKLFLNSPSLEFSRVGQYFFNYMPWLQYKFRWLLYPTSTYKRFDSFRHIQQHSNKKFYFSSLLKFYQVNLFRWQQTAALFVHNQSQSRNFFIHLFFHKYKLIFDLKNMHNFFSLIIRNFTNSDILNSNLLDSVNYYKINLFSKSFLSNISSSKFENIFHFYQSKDENLQYNSQAYQFFIPFFSFFDFKFFQYSIDFRRWKSLQTNYLRDWKFENYIKYLGPLLYKYDIPTLMGFFAPFEYRNQIFVSKMRNDSLRFSIFFPKKLIVEENPFLSNPRYPKKFLQKQKLESSLFPSFYAFFLNKPYIVQGSNYSYFLDSKISKRNRLFLRGLSSHLKRLDFNSKFNLNYGSGFSERIFSNISKVFSDISYGFSSFNDLNYKKKRLLLDKVFWLSRAEEIKQIGSDAQKVLFDKSNNFYNSINVSKFSLIKLTTQLGKSLDLVIPIIPPKIEFFLNQPIDLNSKFFKKLQNTSKIRNYSKKHEFSSFLNPTIYFSFGGPKALSYRWHRGQSWLKFVVASQNSTTAGTYPGYGFTKSRSSANRKRYLPDKAIYSLNAMKNFERNNPSFGSSLNTLPDVLNFNFFSYSLNGKFQPPPFIIPESSGHFNFGLSGIGRLPRLSRSFFHAIFSRNKLENFTKLKKLYLKFSLMSIPLFHHTVFSNNSSFSLFWVSLIDSKYLLNKGTFRYNVFFHFFSMYKIHPDFSTCLLVQPLGILFDSFFLKSNDNLILQKQYENIKNFDKFFFFLELSSTQVNLLNDFSVPKHNLVNSSSFSNLFFGFFNRFFFIIDSIIYYSFFEFYKPFGDLYLLCFIPFQFFFTFLDFYFFEINFVQKLNNLIFSNSQFYVSRTQNRLLFNKNYYGPLSMNFNVKTNNFSLQYFEVFNFSLLPFKNSFFFSFFNNLFIDDFFKSRLYKGSFRSKIYWFNYPVHFFVFLEQSFLNSLKNFFFYLINFSSNGLFKYNSLLSNISNSQLKFYRFLKFSNLLFFEDSNKNFFLSSRKSFFVNPASSFLHEIFSFHQNLFSYSFFNENFSFRIKFFYQFYNKEYFNSFFNFKNLSKDSLKFVSAFSSFFFSTYYFNKFSFYNNFLNFNFNVSNFAFSNFISNSEIFFDNVSKNARSIESSGRYTRTRSFLYSMDKVYTYREFDKYRREHHRQRFRSITPHWIQNSLKNRYNFTHYQKSPDRRHKLGLRKMSAIRNILSGVNRNKNSSIMRNRISTLNYFTDDSILNHIFPYFFEKTSFKDTSQSYLNDLDSQFLKNYMLSFLNTENFKFKSSKKDLSKKVYLKIYKSSNLLTKRSYNKFIVEKISENLSKDFKFNSKSDFLKFSQDSNLRVKAKTPSKAKRNISAMDISKYGHSKYFLQNFEKSHHKLLKWNTSSRKANLPTFYGNEFSVSSFLNQSQDQSSLLKNLSNKKNFSTSLQFFLPPKSYKNFKLFLNLSNEQFVFSKTFPASSQNVLKKFFKKQSIGKSVRVHWNLYDFFKQKGFPTSKLSSFFSHHTTIRQNLENSRRVQPRFYKSKLVRSFEGSTQPGVGGKVLSNKYAPYKYALFYTGKDSSGPNKKRLKHFRNYTSKNEKIIRDLPDKQDFVYWHLPNNVRRFLRPYNKVLMQMPFIYSKWYIQNPRLSFSFDNKLLSVFIDGSFEEFNNICFQSLFILKRKIMFNIINLKMISMKSKLLYFADLNVSKELFNSTFPRQSKYNIVFNYFFKKIYLFSQGEFVTIYIYIRFLYDYYVFLSQYFFEKYIIYSRLLSNPSVSKFKHDSFNEFIFSNTFYYNYAAKRLLAQIGLSNSTLQGWHNPIGINGQYLPGLNFYFGKFPFNFAYQYPDFFSGKSFSPEFFLLNNLYRETGTFSSRDLFFGEYPIDFNYRPSWHFLSFHIVSPLSPFVEYQISPQKIFTSSKKQRQWRLPPLSFRKVSDIYPSHLSAFFRTFQSEFNPAIMHDVTLPLKIKFLNFNLKSNPTIRRELEKSLKSSGIVFLNDLDLFSTSLNLKQISVLSSFNKRTNFSNLVNSRRFSLRLKQWASIRYNFYYLFNWKSFLHKYAKGDSVGVRNYKLNPYFDLFQGSVPFTLKSKGLNHVIISQVLRSEIDARRRVPSKIPIKQLALSIFKYFNYVNENFYDSGYFFKEQKILRYVNRKVHPYLAFSLPSKNEFFPFFIDYGFSYYVKNSKKNISPVFFNKRKFLMLPFNKKTNFDNFAIYLKSSEKVTSFAEQEKLKISKILGLNLNKRKDFIFYKFKNFFFKFIKSTFDYVKDYKRRIFFYWLKNSPIVLGPKDNFNKWFHLSKFSKIFIFKGFALENKSRFSFRLFKLYLKKKQSLSRIFSIYQLFEFKKRKERSLNPQAWLSFDFFSRVRPSFRPFLFKLSNSFIMSKTIPTKGYFSYNFQIKSHTRYDNFFDRHPYISFGIGSFSDNSLLLAESAYKEIRKRSNILDFSKRLSFRNSPNYALNPRFKSDLIYRFFNNNSESSEFDFSEMSNPRSTGKVSFIFGSPSNYYSHFKSQLVTPKFALDGFEDTEAESKSFRESSFNQIAKGYSFLIDPQSLYAGGPSIDLESKKGLSFYPINEVFEENRRKFSFRFNNFYKNSVLQSHSISPDNSGLLLNTQLLRPYTFFLKFLRKDNFVFKDFLFISNGVSLLNNYFNLSRNSVFRPYYQPNLKVFFDFNAYKQRYNLALLFRELSFDKDFELFLLKRKKFLPFKSPNFSGIQYYDFNLLIDFSFFQFVDFLNFKNSRNSGEFFSSKNRIFFSDFDLLLSKINFFYIFLILCDFFLSFFFSFFAVVKYLNFFDFSFFTNFFSFSSFDFVFYNPNASLFQLLFHVSVLREYLKFYWLFSLKFLIFNFEYYLYYFFFFWFLLVSRLISLKVRRFNFRSPYLIPYNTNFSDFRLNSYNGWFETAWKDILNDSIDRLNKVSHSKDIKLKYTYPLSFEELDSLKKKYRISLKQTVDDSFGNAIDETFFFSNKKKQYESFIFFKLKKLYGKLNFLGLNISSSSFSNSSNDFILEDVDSKAIFSDDSNLNFLIKLPKDKSDIFQKVSNPKFFSFKIFSKVFFLFLKRKIKFFDFIKIFNFGKDSSSQKLLYNLDDFQNDFDNLFLSKDSEFYRIINQNVKGFRMLPEDENIHFYRKPSTFAELQKDNYLGTETDQHNFILEFPGKFGNNHVNSFSKLHTIRNLNYNNPQFGFFSFPRNAKTPSTFNEFLIFFSLNTENLSSKTGNPFFSKQLVRYYNLWSLFQHVTRHDYNIASYYNLDEIRFNGAPGTTSVDNRFSFFDNFKFWSNKASNDALDFNLFNPYFFFPNSYNTFLHETNFKNRFLNNFSSISAMEKAKRPGIERSPYDSSDIFLNSSETSLFRQFTPFSFSFLYILYTYIFLFFFFFMLVIFFCFFFLCLLSFFNYICLLY
jgi:hypothetical protein